MLTHDPKPVVEALYAENPDRATVMVALYGEVCTVAQAGKIIGRSFDTVKRMMEDGRLSPACEGTRVDVRSIARYIEAPAAKDFETRLRMRRAKAGVTTRFYV